MLVIGISNISHNNDSIAIAEQQGDYYYEGFSSYANGTTDLSSSISGDAWVTVERQGGAGGIITLYDDDKQYMHEDRFWTGTQFAARQYSTATGASSYTWVNFTGYTTYIRLNLTCEDNAGNTGVTKFYSPSEQLIGSFTYQASDNTLYVNDEDGTQVDTHLLTVDTCVNYEIRIFPYTNNNTVYIQVYDWNSGGAFEDDFAWTPDTFDYISIMRFQRGTGEYHIGAITISEPDNAYIWEEGMSGYNSFGDVRMAPTGTTTSTSQDNYILETDYEGLNQDIYIRQLALSVDDLSGLTTPNLMDCSAKIDDVSLGYFSGYYVHPLRGDYIMVWQNVNKWINDTDDLTVEFNFIKTYGSPQLTYNIRYYDSDRDGDVGHYFSTNTADYNGDYGGDYGSFYNGEDIIYQIWYESADEYADYGDVEDGNNESLCIGEPNNHNWGIPEKPYLEFRDPIPFSGEIKAFDLYVGDAQYNEISNDLNDYHMFLNGIYQGSPSYWMDDGTGHRILRWTQINESVDNEKMVVELQCNEYVLISSWIGTFRYYWNIGTTAANAHCPSYKMHDDILKIGNGIWEGDETVYNTPSYCFWYTTLEDEEPPEDAEDIIRVGINPLYGNHTWSRYQSIPITGTVKTKASDSYIQIWEYGGSQYIGAGWGTHGKNVEDCNLVNFDFRTSFVADSGTPLGHYEARLIRNDEIQQTAHFNITDISEEKKKGYMFTDPNPSTTRTFNIIWLYDPDYFNGNNAGILYSYTDSSFKSSHSRLVENIQGNGSMTWTSDYDGNIYFWICSFNNGKYQVIYPHVHTVGISQGQPSINVETPIAYLDDYSTGIFTQRFYGYHNSFGQDVWVEDNGDKIADVGNEINFEFTRPYTEAGFHDIRMYKWNGTFGTKTQIAKTSFTIAEASESDDTLLPTGIDPFVGLLVGAFIIIVMMFAPLLIIAALNLNFQPHPIIYAFSTGMGLVVAISLGFWEMWTAFVVIVLGVLAFLFVYFRRGA